MGPGHGFGYPEVRRAAAVRGVIGSMREQIEQANRAASGEEESRYAQYTLADMRANVEAGVYTYEAFKPWLLSLDGGKALDVKVTAGFKRIQDHYATLPGDALPEVPAHWSAQQPSAEDLATPFGQLYQRLTDEADGDRDGSLVEAMEASADLLGIPQLP